MFFALQEEEFNIKQLFDKYIFHISIAVFCITCAFIVNYLLKYTTTDKDVYYLTINLDDTMGWEVYTIEDGEKKLLETEPPFYKMSIKPDETVYFSRIMTEDSNTYTNFKLGNYNGQCSVFLDNLLIFTTFPQENNQIGLVKFPESQFEREIEFALPPNYEGKTLTIATAYLQTTDSQNNLVYISPTFKLSNSNTDKTLTYMYANRASFPSVAFAIAAIVVIGLFLYVLTQKLYDWSLLLLFFIAIAQMLYYISIDEGSLFLDKPPFFIINYTRDLFYCLPLIFLFCQMNKWKKWFAPFVLLPPTLYICKYFLAFVMPEKYFSIFEKVPYLTLMAIFMLIIFSILEYREQNKFFMLFTYGISITTIFIIVIYISSRFGNKYYKDYIDFLIKIFVSGVADNMVYWINMIILIMCFIIIFLYVLIQSIDNFKKKTILEQQKQQSEHIIALQRNQHNLMQRQIEQTAIARHDLRQHLNLIQAYLNSGDNEALKQYLDVYGKRLPLNATQIYSQNYAIDTIIRYYAEVAVQNKIEFNTKLELPETLTIAEPDLCVVIGNLLENAIEACQRQTDGYKFIKVCAVIINEKTISLTVDNSTYEKPNHKDNIFLSSKEKRIGTGTQSIKNIASQYNGIAEFKWDNNIFYASVLLNL